MEKGINASATAARCSGPSIPKDGTLSTRFSFRSLSASSNALLTEIKTSRSSAHNDESYVARTVAALGQL